MTGRKFQPIFAHAGLNTAQWRYAYNPLRGMTMQSLVDLLNLNEQGFHPDLMWLFRFVEKRDAVLSAVKKRRFGALKKLDWTVKVRDKYSENEKEGRAEHPDVAAQREYLTEVYDEIDNMKEAVEFLATADFRGFAHLEKHYRNDRVDEGIHHLEPVPQWFWLRRLPDPTWFYNPNASQASYGIRINTNHFLIREVDSPIDEIASICFLRKNMSQKDWDGFVETFGIPPLFVELPQGTGGSDSDEFQELVEAIIGDSRGVLPNGATVKSVPDGQRGGRPFEEHIKYQDEQVVLAATGGLLTTLAESTGMNSGNSENHRDSFDDIASGEAALISETFQRQMDESLLLDKFPGQLPMVYFELDYKDIGDDANKAITDAGQLMGAGYRMDKAELEERTGYKLLDASGGEAAPGEEGMPGAPGEGEEPATMEGLEGMGQEIDAAMGERDEMMNKALEGISDYAGNFLTNAGIDPRRSLKMANGMVTRLENIITASKK